MDPRERLSEAETRTREAAAQVSNVLEERQAPASFPIAAAELEQAIAEYDAALADVDVSRRLRQVWQQLTRGGEPHQYRSGRHVAEGCEACVLLEEVEAALR